MLSKSVAFCQGGKRVESWGCIIEGERSSDLFHYESGTGTAAQMPTISSLKDNEDIVGSPAMGHPQLFSIGVLQWAQGGRANVKNG